MDERDKSPIEQYADSGYRAPFTLRYYPGGKPSGDVVDSEGDVILECLSTTEAALVCALLNDRPEFQPKDTD